MDAPLKIGVIIASVREGRRGENFARWIHGVLCERKDISAELLDLKACPLPNYAYAATPNMTEKTYTDKTALWWVEKISAQDGFVIVTPEYGHGYPGSLKNLLDHVYAGWGRKPVAFLSYGGSAAGARAVEQLRLVSIELRMVPVRDEVNLRLMGLEQDEQGRPKDEFYAKRASAMIADLSWWARTAKEGRRRAEVGA